ncbi:MAG: hypothetical protein SFU27_03285 [Thermonemataceae bacterium]|nr:hypothetical protein [Thermonemataceae bacterium]
MLRNFVSRFASRIYVSIFYLSLLLFSCSSEKNIDSSSYWQAENALDYKSSLELQKAGFVKFPIQNNVSLADINFIECLEINGEKYIYFYEKGGNSLFIYDILDFSLRKKITFEKEGKNRVVPNNNLVKLISIDSLWLYDRTERRLSLFHNASLLKYISLEDNYRQKNQLNVTKDAWQFSYSAPFDVVDNVLYVSLYPRNIGVQARTEENIVDMAVWINTNNFQAGSFLPYPNFYNKGNWGYSSVVKTNLFQTYNASKKTILYGFAADNFLYEFDIKKRTLSKKFIGSSFFKEIPPLSFSKVNENKDKSWKYVGTTPSYYRLFYFSDLALHARIAFLPKSEQMYIEGVRSRDFSLIFFDENIQKNAEFRFNNSIYNPSFIYADKQYIYILRQDLYDKDDNFLWFEKFQVIKHI